MIELQATIRTPNEARVIRAFGDEMVLHLGAEDRPVEVLNATVGQHGWHAVTGALRGREEDLGSDSWIEGWRDHCNHCQGQIRTTRKNSS